MSSASYLNDAGVLTPDNWLVSPRLPLNGILKVWMKGQDTNDFQEHVAIYACGEAPTITDNELVAVPESTHINATDGAYTNFMMSGGKFIRIADESEDVKMPANRAYLPLLTDAVGNAKSVTLLWGATGIESLTPPLSILPASTVADAAKSIYITRPHV